MHEQFGLSWKLAGEIKDSFDVAQARSIGVIGIVGVLEKAEKQFGSGGNILNFLPAVLVIKEYLVPDGDDMGPSFASLVRQVIDTANGQVNFHEN
jgi:hypothetical protein